MKNHEIATHTLHHVADPGAHAGSSTGVASPGSRAQQSDSVQGSRKHHFGYVLVPLLMKLWLPGCHALQTCSRSWA